MPTFLTLPFPTHPAPHSLPTGRGGAGQVNKPKRAPLKAAVPAKLPTPQDPARLRTSGSSEQVLELDERKGGRQAGRDERRRAVGWLASKVMQVRFMAWESSQEKDPSWQPFLARIPSPPGVQTRELSHRAGGPRTPTVPSCWAWGWTCSQEPLAHPKKKASPAPGPGRWLSWDSALLRRCFASNNCPPGTNQSWPDRGGTDIYLRSPCLSWPVQAPVDRDWVPLCAKGAIPISLLWTLVHWSEATHTARELWDCEPCSFAERG